MKLHSHLLDNLDHLSLYVFRPSLYRNTPVSRSNHSHTLYMYIHSHSHMQLSIQVFMVFIVNDFGNRMFNSVIQPYVLRRYKKHEIDRDPRLGKMGPIEAQFKLLAKYDTSSALVLDYIEVCSCS
jgi:hypothetical protein